jgi:predicted amidophosphoribosyltransferase
MTTPLRFRYEPLPPGQPACTGCWEAAARYRVWQGRHWVAALCEACGREHRREHRPAQGELWEDGPDEGRS